MDREILFRGKRIDNGEWVESDSIFRNDIRVYICVGIRFIQVLPETVGQYTGLTDKNDTKIFEGDIVLQPVRETRKHSPCVVEFRNGCYMAHYKSKNRFFDRYYNINTYTKVIGNVRDNPELLEVTE